MTIDKAIEILNQQHNFRDTPYAIELDDALKLSIEALKRLQNGRAVDHAFACVKLLSETK